jgi:hypothetical protein
MSDTDGHEKTEAEALRDAFCGLKGREPQTDEELKAWLQSPEGQAAMAFNTTDVSRWGETGRS